MHDNHSSDSLKLFPDSTFEDVYIFQIKKVSTMLLEWHWGTWEVTALSEPIQETVH